MKLSTFATCTLAASASAAAVEKRATSLCDKYTTALFGTNSGANQQTLLTLLVNTVVIGNYSSASTVAPGAPGILTTQKFEGETVNLLQYFDGSLKSTNQGGTSGVSVNFLDGGGAAPLLKNKPANSKNSNQYYLITHLYTFFAGLLGCSKYGGGTSNQPYPGTASMYQVHKFMALDKAEFDYFVYNVGTAATSFGVTQQDAAAVGAALNEYFGYKCEPYSRSLPSEPLKLNSICTDYDCPKANPARCDLYAKVVQPSPA